MRFVQLNPSFIGRPPGLQQTERQQFPVFMWIKPLDLRDFRISKPRHFAPSKPRVLSIPGAHQGIWGLGFRVSQNQGVPFGVSNFRLKDLGVYLGVLLFQEATTLV